MLPPVHAKLKREEFLKYNQCLLIFYRCWSLFPVAKSPRWRCFLEVYAWFWCIFCLLLLARVLHLISNSDVFVQKSISGYIALVIFGITIFINIFVTAQVYRHRQQHARLYEIVQDIDRIFEDHLGVAPNYQQEAQLLLGKTWQYFMIILACISGFVASSYFSRHNLETIALTFLPGIGNRIFCLLYVNFMRLIYHRLQLILDVLKQKIPNSKIELVRGHPCYERNKLLNLKEIYGKLWLLSDWMQQCFGFCLLAAVLLLSSVMVVNLYWLFLSLMGSSQEVFLGMGGTYA